MLEGFDQKYTSDEAAVQDLVSTFLIPEVDRQLVERKGKLYFTQKQSLLLVLNR